MITEAEDKEEEATEAEVTEEEAIEEEVVEETNGEITKMNLGVEEAEELMAEITKIMIKTRTENLFLNPYPTKILLLILKLKLLK